VAPSQGLEFGLSFPSCAIFQNSEVLLGVGAATVQQPYWEEDEHLGQVLSAHPNTILNNDLPDYACAQCGSWESGVGRGMSDQTVSHPTPKTNSQRHANEFPKARIGGNGGMLMGKAESGHVSGLFAHGLRPNSESRGRNSDAVRW